MSAIRPTTTPLATVPPAVASQPPANPNAILSRYQPTGASADTASQDGLTPGVQASRTMARTDLPHLQPHAQVFAQAAQKHGLPPAVLAAIASRESRGGTQLDSRGWGLGDSNGYGLMQVDRNSHTPRGGPFSAEHVDQAAGILKGMLGQVKADHPEWPPEQQLRGAIAAYNMGPEHVKTLAGMDEGTTGDDYSNDVWARAQELAPHFGGATSPTTGPTRPAQPPPSSSGNSSFEQPATQRPGTQPPAGNLLAQGSRGPEVKSLQEQLNRAGANLEADGVYGPATAQAVRTFQQRHNLPADGIVGDMTRSALEQQAPSAPQGLLTQGAEGPAVLQLQQQLNKAGASLQEDGSFGPATERAVRDFQRQQGLPADGMVGSETQQKLDEVVRSGGGSRPAPSTGASGTPPQQGTGAPASGVASRLQPIVQQDATSCGLASVAMIANAAHANAGTGKAPIDDQDLRRENGGGTGYLPTVLNSHLQGTGLRATDEDWSSNSWDSIRQSLDAGHPVLLSTNGEFSASGYGHYIALTKMEGNRVQYADPADGQLKWTTTDTLDAQPPHTDGRWFSRVVPE